MEMSKRAKEIKDYALMWNKKLAKELKDTRLNEFFNALCEWQAENETKTAHSKNQ